MPVILDIFKLLSSINAANYVAVTVPKRSQIMATEYASLRNLKFLLFDVHQAENLASYELFAPYNKETIEMLLSTSRQLSDTYLYPYYTEMDEVGVRYEKGKVDVHPQVGKFLRAVGEGGWIGSICSVESGGMQMPVMVSMAAKFLWEAANNAVSGYAQLTSGAARLIDSFGNDELKKAYIPKMFAGEWQGTMALTEPQAGSALSYITTSATPKGDGSYRIKGQKIFISGGDHNEADNVIHLMLARIDGAPQGTKGISLFVVPKKRFANGDQLEDNDVTTAGIFHKMGQHAYVTTHLIMGEKDDCHGYLVGEANKGLGHMFQMMNEARIGVGLSATATASAAYYAALAYCNERPQGRRPGDKPDAPQTMIINHPDVRRMLFLQKAFVEGTMSLLFECSAYSDLTEVTTGEEKKKYEMLLDLLTPVVKAYATEMSIESISNGLQCLGGYGYCMDFPLQQYYRDVRIMALYEGTTGIQSQDLLGRKVMAEDGLALRLMCKEVEATVQKAQQWDSLKEPAALLMNRMNQLEQITKQLAGIAMKGEVERFLADANLYMDYFGVVAVAWQWLKQGIKAQQMLEKGSDGEDQKLFLESKLHTLRVFYAYEIPKTEGLAKRLIEDNPLTLKQEREFLI